MKVCAWALLSMAILGGCGDDDTDMAGDGATRAESVRGKRYCEVLLVYLAEGEIEAQVWGTQGLNDCPAAQWDAIDADAIRAEAGATAVRLNGPRYWVLDHVSAVLPDEETRRFGALEMRRLATVELTPEMAEALPYVERTVLRDSELEFESGAEVYELVAPSGSTYVMQSYAQIVDPALTEEALGSLADRLELPEGWSYRARILSAALTVVTPGRATVVQDELQNTYSLYGAAE